MVTGEFMNKKIKRKFTGLLFIISSILYLVIEYIVAQSSTVSINQIYLRYSISQLAMPLNEVYMGIVNNFSPLYNLINIALIVLGILFLICCISEINKRINSNQILYYPLMMITAIGMILLGIYTVGINTINNHQLAITMALLGGNLFLIVIGRTINTNKIHRNISAVLGIIGLISFILMIYTITNGSLSISIGILERIALYTILIWNIITGIYLIQQ